MSASEPGPEEVVGGGDVGDDEWKAKAQAEKEQLASEPVGGAESEIPPASFQGLLEELSVRALFSLGQLPDPRTGQPQLDLGSAKYTIDLLVVLQDKTRGNLDEADSAYLTDLVHRLRLAYVEISRAVGGAGSADGGPTGPADGGPADGEPTGGEPRIIV